MSNGPMVAVAAVGFVAALATSLPGGQGLGFRGRGFERLRGAGGQPGWVGRLPCLEPCWLMLEMGLLTVWAC